MIKYTRTQINKKASLHDKEFITVDDALSLMDELCKAAVKAGADEVRLMEVFDNEKD